MNGVVGTAIIEHTAGSQVQGMPHYWTGDATNRLTLTTHSNITSSISVSGIADIVTWYGSITQPVKAAHIERLQAYQGYYNSGFAGGSDSRAN